MEITMIITTTLSIIAIVTTVIVSIKEIKNANKLFQNQTQNDFFEKYTKRYQDIILAMPDEVFDGTAEINGRTLKYMQLYFDLCCEEYNLHLKGIIPGDIWENWKEGMRITVKLQLYSQCWKRLNGIYNKDFYLFFETDIISK